MAGLGQTDAEHGEAWQSFQKVSIVEFLKADTRPSVVLDLRIELESLFEPLHPIFVNAAFFRSRSLNDFVEANALDREQTRQSLQQSFFGWARETDADNQLSIFQFAGAQWESMTLEGRWRILTARPVGSLGDSPTNEPMLELVPSFAATPSFGPPGTALDTDRASQRFQAEPIGDDIRTQQMNVPNLPQENLTVSKNVTDRSRDPVSSMPAIDNAPISAAPQAAMNCLGYDHHSAVRNAELLDKIAKIGVVAIWAVNNEGKVVFANDRWHELTGHPRSINRAMTWVDVYEDDELPKIVDLWKRCLIDLEPVQYQARLKARWRPSDIYPSAPVDLPTWITAWAYPDIDQDGKMLGACGVWTEISELKWGERLTAQKLADVEERAELLEQLSLRRKEVAETEARFRRLCDMMPCGVWVSDSDGKVLYANDAYGELLPPAPCGTSPEPWWEMALAGETPRAHEFHQQAVECGAKLSSEFRLKRSRDPTDISYRWVLAVIYPELVDGQLKYITGCITDISHWKGAEELQSLRAIDAVESKRQLERFIDMTSHEIRNPLSAIVHLADEILTSLHGQSNTVLAVGKDAIEAAETIILCTEHSTRIVDDILLVSKLESGLLNISPTIVQPITVIRSALKMFDAEMRAAGIAQSLIVDQSFKELLVEWVHLDAIRVRQIFVNLITNAIKFTKLEELRQINVRMSASLERPMSISDKDGLHYLDPLTERSITDLEPETKKEQTAYITVSVQDTGCGLTMDEQKNLFQRFSQAGKRTHVKYGGTGLGLFISRQLCEMQGGQIGLKSAAKQGSTFSFYVMASMTLAPDAISKTSTEAKAPGLQAPPTSQTTVRPTYALDPNQSSNGDTANTGFRHTILLVEDNLINQKVVAKKLTTKGYEVVVANHGLEALDRVKESTLWSQASSAASSISMILLDLEMPVMDGLTCIRHLREMEQSSQIRCHVPVIAITANARQDQKDQAKKAGMDDVVTKPFRVSELFTTMERLMDQFPVPG